MLDSAGNDNSKWVVKFICKNKKVLKTGDGER